MWNPLNTVLTGMSLLLLSRSVLGRGKSAVSSGSYGTAAGLIGLKSSTHSPRQNARIEYGNCLNETQRRCNVNVATTLWGLDLTPVIRDWGDESGS